MKYSLRAWKIIDNNNKQIIDIIESENVYFIKLMHKQFKELYNYYNYQVELKAL